MSAENPLLDAISTNDLPNLHSLLEDQDRQLFSQTAQYGTPEIAAYLLSRYPVPEDYSQELPTSNPTLHPIQYLACKSARNGNGALFRYLLKQYPSLLFIFNGNIDNILMNAIAGGVSIWKIILEHNPLWKDHKFKERRGCVLEHVIWYGNTELLEFLLREGADADPVAMLRGAPSEMLELIKKYSA